MNVLLLILFISKFIHTESIKKGIIPQKTSNNLKASSHIIYVKEATFPKISQEDQCMQYEYGMTYDLTIAPIMNYTDLSTVVIYPILLAENDPSKYLISTCYLTVNGKKFTCSIISETLPLTSYYYVYLAETETSLYYIYPYSSNNGMYLTDSVVNNLISPEESTFITHNYYNEGDEFTYSFVFENNLNTLNLPSFLIDSNPATCSVSNGNNLTCFFNREDFPENKTNPEEYLSYKGILYSECNTKKIVICFKVYYKKIIPESLTNGTIGVIFIVCIILISLIFIFSFLRCRRNIRKVTLARDVAQVSYFPTVNDSYYL